MATAPVLFAAAEHPVLRVMAARKFSEAGDAKIAFELVLQSDGLDRQGRAPEGVIFRDVSAFHSANPSQKCMVCD